MPLAVGTVGGALHVHPGARLALELAGVERADRLAALAGAAGLATNLAALRALATEGIQRGHMALHARGLARAAGATGEPRRARRRRARRHRRRQGRPRPRGLRTPRLNPRAKGTP